jgi:hypothetical protein
MGPSPRLSLRTTCAVADFCVWSTTKVPVAMLFFTMVLVAAAPSSSTCTRENEKGPVRRRKGMEWGTGRK